MNDALIIVDVQEGWAGACPTTTQAIAATVERLRPVMPVVWVYMDDFRYALRPDQWAAHRLRKEFNRPYDSNSQRLRPSIAPHNDDWVMGKEHMSAFYQTGLEAFLKERSISNLYLGGYMIDQCLYFTAGDAVWSKFNTTVLTDLTAHYRDKAMEPYVRQMYTKAKVNLTDSNALSLGLK